MEALEIIQPENSLLLQQQVIQISSHILKQFEGLSNQDLAKLKNDDELIKMCMTLVEAVFTEKKVKRRKKDIVLQILHRMIPVLTDEDKRIINDKIEFLHSNNLIKQVTKRDIVKRKVLNFFSSKQKA